MPLMSNAELLDYLRKTYPQLTEAELLQMCREAGYDLTPTPPLPAVRLGPRYSRLELGIPDRNWENSPTSAGKVTRGGAEN